MTRAFAFNVMEATVSIRIMTAVWDEPTTKGSERLVLLALADSANDEGFCWPSLATIAKKCNLERRYVIDIIQTLEKHGLIEVERRKKQGKVEGTKFNQTSMYRVLVHLSSPPAEVVRPASPASEARLTRVVRPGSPESLINRNEPPIEYKKIGDPFDEMQSLAETKIGYPVGREDAQVISEWVKKGVTADDIDSALGFFKEKGIVAKGPGHINKSVLHHLAARTQAKHARAVVPAHTGADFAGIGSDEYDPGDEPAPAPTDLTWTRALAQLHMPRKEYYDYVDPCRVVTAGAEYVIAAPDAAARDWLAGRLTSTLARILTGVRGADTTVKFITEG